MDSAIRLCGRLEVTLAGRSVTDELPGRQGRLVLAYLASTRGRPVTRDQLADLLWPSDPPAAPDEVLGALLSKLRRALGPGVIEGRRDLTFLLPDDARIDVEIAAQAIERAEAALAAGDARLALGEAQTVRDVVEGGFLPGFDNPWVDERRRELEDLRLRSLECIAGSALALGGPDLAVGERAARELVAAAPLREPGHRLLMELLAARGDVVGALEAYDRLRVQLRDELGIAPSAPARALHERLLAGSDAVDPPPAPPEDRHREERKLVTVLAAELEASSGADDPEELRMAHARTHTRVREQVQRFGGTVETTAEGAVALFGAPTAHEDDAERAVRAALSLCELRLAVRVGVATGELLVSLDASLATGRAVGDAVRLQRAAPAGGVAADVLTVEATRGSVVYDALDEGDAWVVRTVSERFAAALEHPDRTRFVGRVNELGLLENLYRTVVEDARPSMVAILGQAGVGKSRLTDEFLTLIESSSASVYRGRCQAYGEGTTYWALREILWAATGIRFDDPAATAARKLRRRVDGLLPAPDADRVTAALAVAAGIALPENPLERLSPGSIADEVALAWPALLSGLAQAGPVVVVIEDMHWADEPMVDMVERVLARSTGRLLLVVTARPEFAEERPGWTSRPATSQISLEPLTHAASQELVSELLPDADAQLRERVMATAEGNPFFAEELARHLSEQPEDSLAIPTTVRALLAARVDRLPEREKQVVQDAAAVGRVFWATTIESIEARAGLPEALRVLEERGLVVTRPTSSLPGETELSFRHGLTREVAYRSIPRARRCQAHAAVGDWIEQLAGDRRDEFIDLLAHHYEAAAAPGDAVLAWPAESEKLEQLRAKAVRTLIEAGHAARRRLATDQAVRFAERAMALAASDRERLAALELEARTHHAAVRGDQALAAYTAGMEVARALGDEDARSRLRAHATLLCVRYAGAFHGDDWRAQAAELVGEELDDEGRPTFERGALLLGRSWGLHRWASPPTRDLALAKRDVEQAVAIAEAIDSPELLAGALEGLTWLVSEEGFCDAAVMAERLMRASTGSADRVEAHESKVTAAICFGWAGRFDRAAEVARETTVEAAKLSPHRALHSAMAQTFSLVPTGQFAEFGEATNQVLDLAVEDASSSRTCMAAVVGLAGRVLWLYESLDSDAAGSAFDLLTEVRPPPRRSLYDYFTAELLRPFVGIESTRGLLKDLPRSPHDAATAILYLRAQLQLLALAGQPDELETAIAQARELSRSACAPVLGWIADWASAAKTAADDPAGSLERALAATAALDTYGESYTAARLLSDFLPLVDGAALVEETAQRLEKMGAHGSATEARLAVSAG